MSRKRKVVVGSTQAGAESPETGNMLDEFVTDRRSAVAVEPTRARLADLVGNPTNDRDDMGDIEELAESLQEHGLRQPVSVMARETFVEIHPDLEPKLGDASLVVVNGNRRLAAATAAGWDSIPVYWAASPSDRTSLRTAVLVENIHRKNLEPLEEARAVQALVAELGSNAEAARTLKMTRAWVGQRLALLKLQPELEEELRGGRLKIKDARRIGALPTEEQSAAWEETQRPTPAAAPPVNPVYTPKAEPASAAKTAASSTKPSVPPASAQLTPDLPWEPRKTAIELRDRHGPKRFAELVAEMTDLL